MSERARQVVHTPANSLPSRDLLMPVMNVESSVAYSLDGKHLPMSDAPPRVSPTFSACQVVYTAADSKPHPPPVIRPPTAKYGSHETLPTSRPKPRLARAQSEQVDDEPKVGGANRWGALQAKTIGQPQARKDKRRAQIVAAVTRRLSSIKKKSEEAGPAETSEPATEETEDQEPEELKICARARASLKAMVSRRRRAEVETQTEFAPRTVRLKEVGVETDGSAWCCDERKSVATQCSLVADVVDEVYRRWWHHYGNAAPWQRWPNAVFLTQHRFVAPDEEFSDDSLDSNHDGEAKVADGDRPCVWKVLTIASGQHFGGRADLKVAPRSVPRIEAALTKPSVAMHCCRDSINAMQAAIEELQRSLHDRPETSCYIRLCDCRSHAAERRSQATQTAIVTTSVTTQCHAGQSCVCQAKACSCALCRSHQKIKSFVYRWKNKCLPVDEVNVKLAVTGQCQPECVKSWPNPDNNRVEAVDLEASVGNRFPINFTEVPRTGLGPAGKPATFKASQALNEMLNNNNNDTKWRDNQPDWRCAAVQQCYYPVMMNNNGHTSVMGFVKDTDQTFFLPVLASNQVQGAKHSLDTGVQDLLATSVNSNKDSVDLFTDDSDVALPRLFPEIMPSQVSSKAIDGITKQGLDAKRQRWLEIKSMILGHESNVMSSAKEDREVGSRRRNDVAKKRVTWRDYRGCGDLVAVRLVPARDEAVPCDYHVSSYGDCLDRLYGERGRSKVDSVLHRENVSNNNAPNINLTFYPFVNAKQRCEQHCRNFGSRIYLFDSKFNEKPKFFKRYFKTFDRSWEMSPNQTGKIMNMFHLRSKYYEEKLAQLSLIRERRQKGLASSAVGEKSDKTYSHLMSYINSTDSDQSHVETSTSIKYCSSKESEHAGWNIKVNVLGNCVQIGQEGPFQPQTKTSRPSNMVDSKHCGLCMCTQGRFNAGCCRQTAADIHDPSLDRNCNHGCSSIPFSQLSHEIENQTECSEICSSRLLGNCGSVSSERSLKNLALPSKYMRHLLAVRRQIVGSLKD